MISLFSKRVQSFRVVVMLLRAIQTYTSGLDPWWTVMPMQTMLWIAMPDALNEQTVHFGTLAAVLAACAAARGLTERRVVPVSKEAREVAGSRPLRGLVRVSMWHIMLDQW